MPTRHFHSDAPKANLLKRLLRVAAASSLALAVIMGLVYREAIWPKVAEVFAAGYSEAEPVPVMTLSRVPYQLTAPAIGEIVATEAVPIPTPKTPRGRLEVVWLAPEGRYVQPGDLLVQFESTVVRISLQSYRNSLESTLANERIAQAKQQLDEEALSLDLESAELDYEHAMSVLPRDEVIFSKWEIQEAQEDAELAKARIDSLKEKRKIQQRISEANLRVLELQRIKTQTEIDLAQQTLDSLELHSPAAGFVLYRREHRREPQVGDTSEPGEILVEVADIRSLAARIYVLERDGGTLREGQEVKIDIDALPEKSFLGVLHTVSRVPQTLERNSPFRYFTCDAVLQDVESDLPHLRPGMELRADVILDEYPSCFVVPSSAVTMKDSENLVFVQEDGGFTARPVQMGLATHGQMTILAGVEEGEVIALRNPFEERKLYLPDFSKSTAPGENRGGRRMRFR